ncbi:hypothetical protein HMPREF0530_1885 [Lacticaseibacillus paracasei subsp. paracasei ATCC 25302 = DSM 5622 = JCM 8130]|nr:hypothetical protein HMPREF0530_1885 [Lacticaseibacillus paracasei subsp. paracasei ATCC 25302 = DSM 5622 = JCM 8130]GEL32111.1 hypothetical protein LPA04_25720 [Lacticaseibacillus paracasei subsp. paracasei]
MHEESDDVVLVCVLMFVDLNLVACPFELHSTFSFQSSLADNYEEKRDLPQMPPQYGNIKGILEIGAD